MSNILWLSYRPLNSKNSKSGRPTLEILNSITEKGFSVLFCGGILESNYDIISQKKDLIVLNGRFSKKKI